MNFLLCISLYIIYIITIGLLFLLHANFIYKRKIKDEKRINKKSTNLINRILIIAAFDLIKNDKAQISNVIIILY